MVKEFGKQIKVAYGSLGNVDTVAMDKVQKILTANGKAARADVKTVSTRTSKTKQLLKVQEKN